MASKWDFVDEAIAKRKESNRFRTLVPVEPVGAASSLRRKGRELKDFSSNDYLGLSGHPEVKKRSAEYVRKYGSGSRASRLISGTFTIHEQVENKLADLFGLESVMLFNSGFQCNTTVISSIADRNSLVLADRKIHNSLLQGALLSGAELRRYQHNDIEHLEKLLQRHTKEDRFSRTVILTETVFSMDGDTNEVDQLIALARKYDAILYSDDAHAIGVLGEKGLGLNYGKDEIDISVGTFGKSFGSFGAFLGCSKKLKDYLINYCPGFIYTTSLPPSLIGAIDAACDLIPNMDDQRAELHDNIQYLRKRISEMGYDSISSSSQIIPVIIGAEEDALQLSEYLEENGFLVVAIRPPTVETGSSRIRISLTTRHNRQQVASLADHLEEWKNR